MPTPGKIVRFESADAGIVYTFSLAQYEFEEDQFSRTPTFPAAGADGAFDGWRAGVAPVELKTIRLRGTIVAASAAAVDTAVDEMRGEFRRIGRGKLFMAMADASERWTWARATIMPFRRFQTNDVQRQDFRCEFLANPDWYDDALTTDTETVTASGQTWIVNNPGNVPAKLVVLRLRANGAAGITNPKITNQTTGHILESARDSASADDEIRYDTERGAVEYSTDDGSTYADDFGQYVLPTTQVPLTFELAPGNNTLQYTGGGTPALDVATSFYAPFA